MINKQIISKELKKKIEYFSNLNIPPSIIKIKEAIILYFIYESPVNELDKNTLDLFIQTHLKFNDKIVIYIFTNQKIKIPDYLKNRVNIILMDYLDHKIMENRTIFIYTMIKLLNTFDKLYFFDSDVIPLRSYNNLFDSEFDIGLTYHPEYLKEAKYPVNGGFLIFNYKNKNKIENFAEVYLNSYIEVLNNESLIKKTYKIKKPLSVWYGDQLLFLLLGFKFPKLKNKFFQADIKTQKFSIRLFNEFRYNNNVYDIKVATSHKEFQNKKFNFDEYLQILKKSKVYFIHLKGNRRLFATDLAEKLK